MTCATPELFVRTAGAGDSTIGLVHGWASDSRIWDNVMADPPSDLRFVAVDLPGHGRSPLRDGVDRYLESTLELFVQWHQELGDGSAPIVSWAWGGQLVIDALVRGDIHPASVLFVSLPPPQSLPDPYSGPLWRDWPRYCRAIARMMTVQALSPEREDWLAAMMAACSPVAAAAMNRKVWEAPDSSFQLPDGARAILGTADPIGDVRATASLIEDWGGEVDWLGDCGHMPFIETLEAFSRHLEAWVANWRES